MWCEVEREVTKCPHISLASLKVMTSDLMTDLDREVIIHAFKKFWFWIEAVMEATGVFIKQMCMLYACKHYLKVSSKCIHSNYYFCCFECVHRVCPNLSSAPCICPLSCNFVRDENYSERGWACSPTQPAWATFSIMMECTPQSGSCHSVCTLWSQLPKADRRLYSILRCPLVEESIPRN
jgi:hypothetical protein